MILNKSKGEFNFTIAEDSKTMLQYQARYLGEDSEAVRGLGYNFASIKKMTKRARKHQRNKINRNEKTTNGLIPQGGAVGDSRGYG
jgi:hypothetical protein